MKTAEVWIYEKDNGYFVALAFIEGEDEPRRWGLNDNYDFIDLNRMITITLKHEGVYDYTVHRRAG